MMSRSTSWGRLDLNSRHYEPTTAKVLETLRRDNPLQAALYLINAGKIDDAKGLIQKYQDQSQSPGDRRPG